MLEGAAGNLVAQVAHRLDEVPQTSVPLHEVGDFGRVRCKRRHGRTPYDLYGHDTSAIALAIRVREGICYERQPAKASGATAQRNGEDAQEMSRGAPCDKNLAMSRSLRDRFGATGATE